MTSFKILLLGFFYICFFFAFLFNGGRIGLQRPQISYFEQENKITFDKDIKPIMDKSCGGIFCHHGKPSAWTKYTATKTAVDNGSFFKEVIKEKTMPKRKKLSKLEYHTIKKWLEEGAIEK